ncbi:MAG TPA: hypothetical protein VFI08_08150 [Spirochaetia bacterium]|nr:hypothetical protein [Spirochaetia bacterium]
MSFAVVSLMVAFLLTTCAGGGGGSTSPSDVTDVGTVAPASMTASGVPAGNVPADMSTMKTDMDNITSSDPLLNDLSTTFKNIGSGVSGKSIRTAAPNTVGKVVLAFANAVHKDLSSSLQTQLNKVYTDVQNFPTTKSLNENLDLSGNALGTYVYLTKATAAFSGSATTTDGGDLVTSGTTNLKSAQAQASVSLVLDPTGLSSSGSAFKDFKVKVNAGGTASCGTATSGGKVVPSNFQFDYGVSGVLAFSFAVTDSGSGKLVGGKLVLTVSAKNSGTIVDPTALDESAAFSALAPSIKATLTIYDDSGNVKFTQAWNDITTFMTDMGGSSSPS